ncbi:MAG: hypothetical protein Q4G43_14160 [Mobilicoccus sp.]|nr:hypothetical protein [Mobilicoccus sp.]
MPPIRHLLAPTVGTGVFMALYLVLRPGGDASGDPTAIAQAFASPWWVASHLAGMVALASAARLAVRVHDLYPDRTTAAARWTGLAGLAGVLPYYGAETYALHIFGARFLDGDATALDVAQAVRDQPVALWLFGLGLILLAASAAAWATALTRTGAVPPHAIWPLAACLVLVLPQFFLPPLWRSAFGLATLAAALVLTAAILRRRPACHRVAAMTHPR